MMYRHIDVGELSAGRVETGCSEIQAAADPVDGPENVGVRHH